MRLVRGLLVLMVFLQVSPALAQSGGLRLLLPNTAQPQSKQAPAGPGRVSPGRPATPRLAVAGIRMGDGRARFESVLGKPSDTQKLGEDSLVLTYRRRGVQVLYAPGRMASPSFFADAARPAISAACASGIPARPSVAPAGANLLWWPARWLFTGPVNGRFSSRWAKTTRLSNLASAGLPTRPRPAPSFIARMSNLL